MHPQKHRELAPSDEGPGEEALLEGQMVRIVGGEITSCSNAPDSSIEMGSITIIGAPHQRPKCWRLSNIPLAWDRDALLRGIRAIDKSLRRLTVPDDGLSLYPACCGPTKTALLNLQNFPDFLQRLKPNYYVRLYDKTSEKEVDLLIDSHFYGLTPLNDPGDEIVADVVAVTGLAGHAFGSWRNRESHRMWLRDFLPHDVKHLRIMSYGYDSSLTSREDSGHRLTDHTRDFIQQLDNARSSTVEKNRPIIFVGHSLGGILILQALTRSRSDSHYRRIFDSTHIIFLFGTPHQGLRTAELEEMIDDESGGHRSARRRLLEQLQEGSEFLENYREDLSLTWKDFGRKIVSFYETLKTASVKKSESGEYRRDGEEFEMVKRFSAQLFLPSEHRLPVRKNHTDIVKFRSPVDTTYQTVVRHIKECMAELRESKWDTEYTCGKLENDFLENLKSEAFDCQGYRDDLLLKRHAGTCVWFLANEKYRDWIEYDMPSLLWVCGGPGSGKSVLSSFLSEQLTWLAKGTSEELPLTAYFFCDDKDERLRTASAILRNLLVQLLQQQPRVFQFISPEYLKSREKWTFGSLWRVFEHMVSNNNIGSIYLLIDALDECEEDSRGIFLNKLQQLFPRVCNAKSHLKIIITSRPHVPVMKGSATFMEVSLDGENLANDIQLFVDDELYKLANEKNFTDSLKFEARRSLLGGADGMFLWVSLVVENLKRFKSTRTSMIREELKRLPRTLPAVYRKILGGIANEFHADARRILQWVVYAKRPLTLEELKIAIAVQPEHNSMSSMEDEIERNLEGFLTSVFGSFLKIGDDRTVNLVHQSAKDFLTNSDPANEPNSPSPDTTPYHLPFFHISAEDSNLHLAIACLSFLSFDEFDEGPLNAQWYDYLQHPRIKDHPFLVYAGTYWPWHIRAIDPMNGNLWEYFWRLAQSVRRFNLAYQILVFSEHRYFKNTEPLQATVLLGFHRYVEELLGRNADVNSKSGSYGDALQAAAYVGMGGVVELLLEKGANINARGGKYGSALHAAAYGGNERVVRLLLKKGIDVNIQESGYGNALCAAANNGNRNIVQLLMENGADINAQGGKYGNALQAAACNGNEKEVQLLVEKGADIGAQGGEYGNALQAAVYSGSEKIVQLLMKERADVNAQGGIYGNALQAAACRRNEKMVRLLIEGGADINARDGTYGSALLAAADNGHKGILQLLVDKGADVNALSGGHGNALQSAAYHGHGEMVQILVEKGADVNAKGGQFGNALQAAACNDNEETVRLLLEQGADINAQGGEYGNALYAAVHHGNEKVMELLVENGANINARGGKYGNALQAAAYIRDEKMVSTLLESGADINAQGGEHGSALKATAYNGDQNVMELLVKNGADVDAQGREYGSALQVAAYRGQEKGVQLLLDSRANVNAQGGRYGNALQAAAYTGREGVVSLLMEKGADIGAQGGEYGNALQAAAYMGHERVVQLLVERGCCVNTQGGMHGSPLCAAACAGNERVVRLLAEKGSDINAQCGRYGNALCAAAYNGSEEVVQALAEQGADINAQGGEYGHALQAAAYRGNKVVQLLLKKGADIDAQGGRFGNALQAAAYRGNKRTVQLLVDSGADINAHGGKYGNPLLAAAYKDNREVVQLLLDKGAAANVNANCGRTALQEAAENGCSQAVDLLIKEGADVDARDDGGQTALHGAAAHGHEAAAQLLLKAGASTEARDKAGRTALLGAVEFAHESMARLLLENGADAKVAGQSEWTPLQWAAAHGQELIARLLLGNQPDIDENVEPIRIALREAKAHQHEAVVQLLLDAMANKRAMNGRDIGLGNDITPSSHSINAHRPWDRSQFPLKAVLELEAHYDEVWYLEFSHDGARLASAGRDNLIIIYETENFGVVSQLSEHFFPVICVAWSPDDSRLISCSYDRKAKLWDTRSWTCLASFDYHTESLESCAWAPDGQTFITGSLDNQMCAWNLSGELLYTWRGCSTSACAISADGQWLVCGLTGQKIRVYNYLTREEEYSKMLYAEASCIRISQDCRYMLVNTCENEIQLRDIETARISRKFVGHQQRRTVIRSVFAGANDSFVASGSEDGHIYIWHRDNGVLFEKIEAHSGCANAVAWNPKDAGMFASAGDDHKVRIWSKVPQPLGKWKPVVSSRQRRPRGNDANSKDSEWYQFYSRGP